MRNNQAIKRSLKEKIVHIKNTMPSMSNIEISRIVNCAKSTVSYHLNPEYNSRKRMNILRKKFRKLYRFLHQVGKPKKEEYYNDNRLLRKCFRSYLYGRNRKGKHRS